MSEKKPVELTCIVCPNGCQLDISLDDAGSIAAVANALCNRGKEYAQGELVNPVRTLTTTVRVAGGELPLVSVRSDRPIPKNALFTAVRSLRDRVLDAPVKAGEVIVSDVMGTGASIVTTKAVEKAVS